MMNRIYPDTPLKCESFEACGNMATTEDSEGVPLCDECAAEMLAEAEETERKRKIGGESQ